LSRKLVIAEKKNKEGFTGNTKHRSEAVKIKESPVVYADGFKYTMRVHPNAMDKIIAQIACMPSESVYCCCCTKATLLTLLIYALKTALNCLFRQIAFININLKFLLVLDSFVSLNMR